jgi:cytochrome c peroxidase
MLQPKQNLISKLQRSGQRDFDWGLPPQVPLPVIPDDNPMNEEMFQLGRHLFYDKRLAGNGTQSCSSCHQQDKSFSNRSPVAIGSTGQAHPRNAMALVNPAYFPSLSWANPSLRQLEMQLLLPLFGEHPEEQEIADAALPVVVQRLKDEPIYRDLFTAAFLDEYIHYTRTQIVRAIALLLGALQCGRISSKTQDEIAATEHTAE